MWNRFALLACLMTASLHGEKIRIAASDLLADYLRPTLEAYSAENDLSLGFDSIGSLPALDRLRSNEIDMAIIAVPTESEVPRDEFRVYPFAYDVAVIAVNANNPIDEISVGRLGGIYGTSEEYNFTSWADLGLSGWGSRKIKPLSGQEEASISLELFKHTVLTAGGMKPGVVMVKDGEVEAVLEADPASIAIMSRLPNNNTKVKTLMISSTDDAPAYGPTTDNIHFGDYPIRLSFFIVFNPREEERMREIVRVLLDDMVASALEESNIFPLPETVRRKLTIDLDLER